MFVGVPFDICKIRVGRSFKRNLTLASIKGSKSTYCEFLMKLNFTPVSATGFLDTVHKLNGCTVDRCACSGIMWN